MGNLLPILSLGLLLFAASKGKASAAPAAQVPPDIGMDPYEAAVALKAYLLGGGSFGWKGGRSKQVAVAQKVFGIPADGIVGPETRKAAQKWGVKLPPRK